MLWTLLAHVLCTPVCATCTLLFYESIASKICPRRVGDACLTFDVAHDSVIFRDVGGKQNILKGAGSGDLRKILGGWGEWHFSFKEQGAKTPWLGSNTGVLLLFAKEDARLIRNTE